jgi:hypothetical protein
MNPITFLFVAAFTIIGSLFMVQGSLFVAIGFWVLAAFVAQSLKMSRIDKPQHVRDVYEFLLATLISLTRGRFYAFQSEHYSPGFIDRRHSHFDGAPALELYRRLLSDHRRACWIVRNGKPSLVKVLSSRNVRHNHSVRWPCWQALDGDEWLAMTR